MNRGVRWKGKLQHNFLFVRTPHTDRIPGTTTGEEHASVVWVPLDTFDGTGYAVVHAHDGHRFSTLELFVLCVVQTFFVLLLNIRR